MGRLRCGTLRHSRSDGKPWRSASASFAACVPADDGTIIELGRQFTFDIEMRAYDGPGGIQLAMGTMEEAGTRFAPRQEAHYVTISGREAVRAARLLMPRVNGGGASPGAVQGAVALVLLGAV